MTESLSAQKAQSLRFVIPVTVENVVAVFVTLASSRITSTISSSALAAIGMATAVMQVVMAMFNMLTTGTGIRMARQVGAQDRLGASDTVAQAMLLSWLLGGAVTALCVGCSGPLLRLLMPTAEEALFGEAVRYFRILMLSLPLYLIYATLGTVCRSCGNSRSPLVASIALSVAQLLFSWIFVRLCRWEELGAGLAFVVCRSLGAAILFVHALRSHQHFELHWKDIFRPHAETLRAILRLGMPVSVEGVLVQLGYMLAGTMSIALGTFGAGVYQILNTLNNFITVPQTICSNVSLSMLGRLLGTGEEKQARRTGRRVWLAGILSVSLLSAVALLLARPLCGMYSADPAAVDAGSSLLWLLVVMDIAGISINGVDPQLRAGGDVTFVMIESLLGVWAIRLPLTWLFCMRLDMGVFGIFLANTVSLYFRAALGLIRLHGHKRIHRRI